MASLDDVVSNLKNVVTNVAQLGQTLGSTFPRITGTFTLAAATTSIIAQPSVSATSKVFFTPTNGTAALTQRTAGLYHSANNPGASFSISTQSGQAIGTETFEYFVINPS